MSRNREEKGKAKEEPKRDEDLEISWGQRTGNVYYESFTYDGVKYSLYDCVYICIHGDTQPNIGKLVKIWETPSHEKKAETVWFFRPTQITYWLQKLQVKPDKREIFLAAGQGKGFSNVIPLESIGGKCYVVCLSNDKRNRLPTKEELKMADHVFYRTFDVGKHIISDTFLEIIGKTAVRHFFNSFKYGNTRGISKQEEISRAKGGNAGLKSDTSIKRITASQAANEEKGFKEPAAIRKMDNSVKIGSVPGNKTKYSMYSHAGNPYDSSPRKKMKLQSSLDEGPGDDAVADTKAKGSGNVRFTSAKDSCRDTHNHSTRVVLDDAVAATQAKGSANVRFTSAKDSCRDTHNLSTRLVLDDAVAGTQAKGSGNVKFMSAKDSCRETHNLSTRLVLDEKRNNAFGKGGDNREQEASKRNYAYVEVSRKPTDSSKWLKLQHWNEEGLRSARENGTLVLLDNLDPSFTSEEVEDIVWHAFGQKVQAKMIQCTMFGSPYSGRALVLFKTKETADDAMLRLTHGCLVLDSGRPIVGRRNFITESNPPGRFFGHLSIDSIRALKLRRDFRDAVSTSHPSQQNTIEYDLALQWHLLQTKSERWWATLSEEHVKELQGLRKQLEDRHRGQ